MICFVNFIDNDEMAEYLLVCKNITAGTKAQDLFEILDNFMSEHGVDCTMCVSVLMALVPCLTAMEDYRHLFETKFQMSFGPIVLFIEKHSRQNS